MVMRRPDAEGFYVIVGTDSFSYSDRVTGTVCPRMNHLAVFSTVRDAGINHSIRNR